MSAVGLGNDIRNVPSQVVAAFRWGQANLLKAAAVRTDDDVGSAIDVLAFVDCVRAEEYAHCLRVETVVEIAKDLVEVVRPKQQLVGQARRDRRVQHRRIVENVNWRNLEVVLQV